MSVVRRAVVVGLLGVSIAAGAPSVAAATDPTGLWNAYPLEPRRAKSVASFRPVVAPPQPSPAEPGPLLYGFALFVVAFSGMTILLISLHVLRGSSRF